MKILLTNDDGINAQGIHTLRDALSLIGEVTVVAPETEMSAVGHAITLIDPLRVRHVEKGGEFFGYAVNGTPADCVKIAVRALLDEKPDVVVSGVNHGQNIATNVIYSGTVSAATEGMILGIPSVAVSLASFTYHDFSTAATFGAQIASRVVEQGLPVGTLLNVNVPPLAMGEIAGIKVCRMGVSKFTEAFEKRVDPRQVEYYWQGGTMEVSKEDWDADYGYLKEGYVTVSPIHFDLTNYAYLNTLESWNFNGTESS